MHLQLHLNPKDQLLYIYSEKELKLGKVDDLQLGKRMTRYFIILNVLVCVFLHSHSLSAQMMNPHLGNAKAMENELNYEQIPAELTAALAQPGNTPTELVEIYRLWGIAHLVLGENDKARYGFLQLLSLMPDYQMPSFYNPRFRKAFGDIKAEFERDGQLIVQHTALPSKFNDANDAPNRISLQFVVEDKFERVTLAQVSTTFTVNGQSGEPTLTDLKLANRENGVSTYEGTLVNPAATFPAGTFSYYELTYELRLSNAVNRSLDSSPPFEPVNIQVGVPLPQQPAPAPTGPSPKLLQKEAKIIPPSKIITEGAKDTEQPPGTIAQEPQSSNSMVITGIIVGSLILVGGGVLTYFCVVEKACGGEPQPDAPEIGSLDVIVSPEGS